MNREEYPEVLFNDLGFNREQRNAWMTAEVGHRIRHIDELEGREQSECIDKLKAMRPEPVRVKSDEDEDDE